MGNFFDCVRSRQLPICDVVTGHRSATMCHLGAIALRTGLKLTVGFRRREVRGRERSGGEPLPVAADARPLRLQLQRLNRGRSRRAADPAGRRHPRPMEASDPRSHADPAAPAAWSGAQVRESFNGIHSILHYTRAAHFLGLWRSERLVIERFLADPAADVLEAGCGAGRVTLGLWKMGFRSIHAFDFADELVDQARGLAREQGAGSIVFAVRRRDDRRDA